MAGEYRSPGVYAQEEIFGISPSPIANEDVIALVSEVPSSAPQIESLTLEQTNDVGLSKKGIVEGSIKVFSRDDSVEYIVDEDFEVSRSGSVEYTSTTSINRLGNRITNETFQLDSGVSTHIPDFPRGVHNIEVKTTNPAKTYIEYEDYVYDRYSGVLRALPGGTLPRNGDSISMSYNYGIADGEQVIVRYRYADSEYYKPRIFEDPTEVYKLYGNPWYTDTSSGNAVVRENPMSLAASLVFSNGGPATQLMCFPVNPHVINPEKENPTLAEWEYAFDSITQEEVSLVIETSGLVPQHGLLITSVLGASTYQQSRMGLIGRDGIKDGSGRTELRLYARAINNQRIVLTSPTTLLTPDTIDGTIHTVGGQYASAALAGRLTLYSRQDTMTRKSLIGVQTPNQESEELLTQDSAAGLCVLDNRSGFIRVRHGLTTAVSDVNQREISIIRAKDFLIKSMRYALDGSVIGMLMTPDVDFLIQGAATNVLDRMMNAYVITGYQTPQVIQDSTDPTRMRLRFQYTPNYPVNEIVIEFGISPIGTSVIQG